MRYELQGNHLIKVYISNKCYSFGVGMIYDDRSSNLEQALLHTQSEQLFQWAIYL